MTSLGANVQDILVLFKGTSKSKVETLLWLCGCMLSARTVCLWKCADHPSISDSLPTNFNRRYAKMIRFFQTGNGQAITEGIFLLIVKLIGKPEGGTRMFLAMDRTHFETGKMVRNILAVGVVYKNVFIPLAWDNLDKKGNSNTEERLALIDDLTRRWKDTGLPMPPLLLCGDREFIGDEWFTGLDDRSIKFIFRLKSNRLFEIWLKNGYGKKKYKLGVLRRYMKRKNLKSMEAVIRDRYIFNLTWVENDSPDPDEPYLYLISNLEQPDRAGELYRLRWKIECCFKHFKSNGFDLECMRLEGDFKTDLVFAIVSLIYVLAIKEGMLQNEIEPVRQIIYKDKGKTYPAKSVFRVGITVLKDKIRDFEQLCIYIFQSIVHSGGIKT